MLSNKELYDFAIYWIERFKNPNFNQLEFDDMFIGNYNEEKEKGFNMDCGHAFMKKYGQHVFHYNELKKIIDNVWDISLLCSAIISNWRYFTHWDFSLIGILNQENRDWFILALSRLAFLTKNDN